jgi:hypothetical protein
MIKNEEKLILEELEKLQLKFPNWDFSAELKPIELSVKKIKDLIKKVAMNFPDFKFTFCQETYGCLVRILIKPKDKDHEDFAYYKNNSVGYVVYNNEYYDIVNSLKNEFECYDVVVENYIENSRTIDIYFK